MHQTASTEVETNQKQTRNGRARCKVFVINLPLDLLNRRKNLAYFLKEMDLLIMPLSDYEEKYLFLFVL